MEWLEGKNLQKQLTRGPLALEASLLCTQRATEALATAHEHGIVHRDVKPGNLFLPNGEMNALKIIDFGVTQLADGTPLTQSKTVLNTPNYIAPEQAGLLSSKVGAKTDVFALGCVLFECLAGRPAF